MISDHPDAKRRIDEAVEALRVGLTPYVTRRMETAFGDTWHSQVARASGYAEDFALDAYALLKTIIENWREVFSMEVRLRRVRSFISVALDARNRMSHFAGAIEQREALRYLDAILELLRAIGAERQAEIVSGLYTDQQGRDTATASDDGQSDIVLKPDRTPVLPVSTDPAMSAPSSFVAAAPTQADRIRQFACDHYVAPARLAGLSEITIRAGDLHRSMRLSNAIPAVCSAIGGNKFIQMAHAMLAERTGPANGSNVYFRFLLGLQRPSAPLTQITARPLQSATPPLEAANDLELDGALALISCVKSKLAHPAPARLLYTSPWFRGVRDLVESSGSHWFLLSALYGLVAPDQVIAPYDYTLNSLGVGERRVWANKVLERLVPEIGGLRRIVMFAGFRYREFLISPLEHRGIAVDVPMDHLNRGEQLAWLMQYR